MEDKSPINFVLGLVVFVLMGYGVISALSWNDARIHSKAPLDDYVKYHDMTIESEKDYIFGYQDSRKGKAYIVYSDVEHKKRTTMFWQDTAYFYDIGGNQIPKTIPCQEAWPLVSMSEFYKHDCRADLDAGHFQHQYWKAISVGGQGRKIDSWEYIQHKVPQDAVSMEICSHQRILIFESIFEDVYKHNYICSNRYQLEK